MYDARANMKSEFNFNELYEDVHSNKISIHALFLEQKLGYCRHTDHREKRMNVIM